MKRFTARHLIIIIAVLALVVLSIGISGGALGQTQTQPKPAPKTQTTDVYHDLEIFTKIWRRSPRTTSTKSTPTSWLRKPSRGC